MGLMSRNKGKVGEREIAALVADLTGWEVKRHTKALGPRWGCGNPQHFHNLIDQEGNKP